MRIVAARDFLRGASLGAYAWRAESPTVAGFRRRTSWARPVAMLHFQLQKRTVPWPERRRLRYHALSPVPALPSPFSIGAEKAFIRTPSRVTRCLGYDGSYPFC